MKEIIKAIELSDRIDPVDKLLALCELDLLTKQKYACIDIGDTEHGLASLFVWSLTELGFDFWDKIHNAL